MLAFLIYVYWGILVSHVSLAKKETVKLSQETSKI